MLSITMVPANSMPLKTSVSHCSQIWHKRFSPLNGRSLTLLVEQDMVHGLLLLEESRAICEGCMLGK